MSNKLNLEQLIDQIRLSAHLVASVDNQFGECRELALKMFRDIASGQLDDDDTYSVALRLAELLYPDVLADETWTLTDELLAWEQLPEINEEPEPDYLESVILEDCDEMECEEHEWGIVNGVCVCVKCGEAI